MTADSKNIKLNLLKGFACFGVVFIHFTFPGSFGEMVARIASYAVPVFFMIAGYYSYDKNEQVIKRRTVKIGKILLCSYILYFLFDLAYAVAYHDTASWFASHFNRMTPIKYICFCTIDFAVPLWYLIAMIEVYLTWWIIVKKKKETAALKWIPVFFLLNVLLSMYGQAKDLEWFWTMNYLTQGMPWFLSGYFLHTDKAEKLRRINPFILVFTAVAGCLFVALPVLLDLHIKLSLIGTMAMAYGLFLLTLKNPRQSVCKPIEYIGEHLSLYVYIFHTCIGVAFTTVYGAIFRMDITDPLFLWCKPMIVLAASILASWAFYLIVGTIRKKFARRDADPDEVRKTKEHEV